MLTLDISGQQLVTSAEFSVKLKYVNPACYIDSIPGDVGLGIDIEANAYNRAILGNPERFGKYRQTNDRKFPGARLRFKGVTLMAGTLVVSNATRENYSCWLQSELGVLGEAQRDKFITETALPVNQAFVNKHWLAYTPATDDYACIPIKNIDFWEGKGIEIPEIFTYTDPEGKQQTKEETVYRHSKYFRETKDSYVNRELNMLIDVEGYSVVVSPFLYLQSALRELFKANGFYIDPTANCLTLPMLNRLVIYNTYNLMWQTFTTTTEGNYVRWDPYLQQYVYIQRTVVTDTQWYLGTFEFTSLLPKIPMKDFLLGLQNWQNIVFLFKQNNQVQVIDRNSILDGQPYNLDNYFLGSWILGEKKDTILKFIQETDDSDANYSENWHDLSDRREDFAEPVSSLAQLQLINGVFGELRLVTDEQRIYEYTWATDLVHVAETWEELQLDVLVWKPASIMPQPYFFGTSDTSEIEEIKTVVAPIFTPIRQTGNIKSMKSLWKDFKLRCVYQPNGENTGMETIFAGTGGLFAQRWAKWARFWRSRQAVEGQFQLPLTELYYLTNHIAAKYRTQEGEFIIQEMEVEFKGNLMGPVTVKGFKI